jgi:hypothetical protein
MFCHSIFNVIVIVVDDVGIGNDVAAVDDDDLLCSLHMELTNY